jgi:hypothetical protein
LEAAVDDVIEFKKFEQLLIEISKSYINLPADRFGKVIRNDLGRLGRLLNADRCLIYLADDEKGSFKLDFSLVWWPNEDDKFIRELDEKGLGILYALKNIRYAFDKWHRGELLQITDLDELPVEAEGM